MTPTAPAPALDDVLETSSRLIDLMTAEIAALRAMRPRDIAPMQDEKARLAARYSSAIASLQTNPDAVRRADPQRRRAVRESMARMRALARDNVRALGAARVVNERVMRVIAEEVSRQTQGPRGYTAIGTESRANAHVGNPTAAVRLNETI